MTKWDLFLDWKEGQYVNIDQCNRLHQQSWGGKKKKKKMIVSVDAQKSFDSI